MKEEEKILSIYNRKELLRYFEQTEIKRIALQKEVAHLKSQLADIKYLNADEVEHIIGSINTNQEKVHAICNLAIDIDRDKIIEMLNRFLFTDTDNPLEIVSGTATVLTSTGTIADEITKALEGK